MNLVNKRRRYSLRQFSQGLALLYLLFFVVVAVFAHFLPLGFAPNEINLSQIYQPPFHWPLYQSGKPFHWLGTDHLGRDILTNIFFGARTVLWVSFPAMIFALLLGVILGSAAGYFGNKGLTVTGAKIIAFTFAVFSILFYGLYADISGIGPNIRAIGEWLFVGVVLLFAWVVYKLICWCLSLFNLLRRPVSLPLDFIVLKLIELIQTIPRLLLILCLSAFAQPSIKTVILLCVFTYWTNIARLVRGEMLKIKQLPFIEAAKSLGFSHWRIVVRHALPNMVTPIIVAFTFGLSNLMALESTLSFLSIGIPTEVPSWGRSITSIRSNYIAWWTVLFPGLVLCLTVLALQTAGNFIINRLNRRSV